MSSRTRSAADKAAAAVRLSGESCLPVADLAGFPMELGGDRTHPTPAVLLRWGMHGRKCGTARVYLDAFWCHYRLTYITSRAALARFAAEVTAAGNPAAAAAG